MFFWRKKIQNKPYLVSGITFREQPKPVETEHKLNQVGYNTGNMVFVHALDRQLGPDLPNAPYTLTHPRGDIGVIPMANQLYQYDDKGAFAPILRGLKVPLVGIGLGGQAGLDMAIPDVLPGTIDWVRAVVEAAPGNHANIALRGAFSWQIMQKYGLAEHCEIIGCPSLFLSERPDLGRCIAKRRIPPAPRIAVAAGHEDQQHLKFVEHSLARLVTETNGGYVIQSSLNLAHLARGEFDKLTPFFWERCRQFIAPDLENEAFKAWLTQYAKIFFDIRQWIDWYADFDFVVGPRIHAIMLALASGIPALCIVIDARTLELCQLMKIPYVLYSDLPQRFTAKELLDCYSIDAKTFDNNRKELCKRYCSFFKNNKLRYAHYLDLIKK